MSDTLILTGRLDLDGGHEFLARATADVARLAAKSRSSLTIDCSAVDPLDAQTVAMLVVIAHSAACGCQKRDRWSIIDRRWLLGGLGRGVPAPRLT